METAGARVLQSRCGRIEFIERIKQVCRTTAPTCFWILVVSSPTCLWWKRGPVGNFFGQVPQRSGQSSIGKLTCQNLRQYTVNTRSPAQWPHTRIPRANKTCSPTKVLSQTCNQEPNNIQQTYAKPTFSRSPKPTNDKQPTNPKNG